MFKFLDDFFKIKASGSSIRVEVMAGFTTFMTMSYIIFVNPAIIEKSGMPFAAVMTATCLASAFATIIMGLYANYPIGLAPSMGINAFFSYGLVAVMGFSWQAAIAVIFIEGMLFILLTLTNIREKILNSIPSSLKIGIPAGIGMFLAFIGLQNSGIVVDSGVTLITLGDMRSIPVTLSIAGFILTSILYIYRVKGAILFSIVIITIMAVFFGVASMPQAIVSMPPSIAPIFMKMDFSLITSIDFIIVVIILLFVDLFNTVGTLIGVTQQSGMLDKNGNLPRAKKALMADAIGTAAGAAMGVSTVTSYIESIAGVEEGGRTGLTALVIGILFILAAFFSPLVGIVPACATAPALIFVGILMMSGIGLINFKDWTEAIPAVLTIFIMPFTYNIATGIEFGVVSYVVIKLLTLKFKDISKTILILAILFVVKEVFFGLKV